jgi:hypothetical protein
MDDTRALFLNFCSEITGYSPLELETTGLIDLYHKLIEEILAARLTDFYVFAKSVVDASGDVEATERILTSSSVFWPVVSSLINLWYLGNWTQLPDSWFAQTGLPTPGPGDAGRTHTPSSLAYIEQLSYRTADAHPPGAKATGFGTWGWQPAS